MKKELILKKCLNCNALVKVYKDCNCDDCGMMCCGNKMVEIKENQTDAAPEKHIPSYKIENDNLIVTVNHVMYEDHYIEWICLLTENEEQYVYFKPGEEIKAVFNNVTSGKIYAYCNKHELWSIEIK